MGISGIHLVVIMIPEHKSGTFSVTDLMEIMAYLITGVMVIYITPSGIKSVKSHVPEIVSNFPDYKLQ